jgi:hypothetical protein
VTADDPATAQGAGRTAADAARTPCRPALQGQEEVGFLCVFSIPYFVAFSLLGHTWAG